VSGSGNEEVITRLPHRYIEGGFFKSVIVQFPHSFFLRCLAQKIKGDRFEGCDKLLRIHYLKFTHLRVKKVKENPYRLYPFSHFSFSNEINHDHIFPYVISSSPLPSIYFFRVKKVKENPYPLYPFLSRCLVCV
jgi:hypothetical protein